MKAYKGFDKDMKCRGFQFEQGKTYEEEEADLCEKGFHACENPLDVLSYYSLLTDGAENNRFAEVDLEATDETHSDDTKRVGKKIKIRAELTLKGLITAAVDFVFVSSNAKNKASGEGSQLAASGDGSRLAASGEGSRLAASGDRSQLAASGDRSQLAASGDGSRLAASGYGSQLAASGYRSQLAASGYRSQLAASGDRSQLAASGDRSQLAASGYRSQLAASGEGSRLAASGEGSRLAASGDRSVVMNAGINGQAKATKGSWITLSEWENKEGELVPVYVVTKKVDGAKIKANTWYSLEKGKFKEVK
jgi:hypothetical protein